MIGMNFSIKMNKSAAQILAERNLQTGGAVQKYIDSEVIRLSRPYTPIDTSELSKSAETATVLGSGEVIWNTPYARYQYYGKVMVGPAPKTVTSKDLKYHGGGGKKWFEAMKAAHKGDILRGAAELAGGKAT